MSVEVGWSKNPNAQFRWGGGPVSGVIAPDRRSGMRLVAATAPPGLQPSAPPSTATDLQQSPALCRAMVRLRGNRADHLWPGAAAALEEGIPKP